MIGQPLERIFAATPQSCREAHQWVGSSLSDVIGDRIYDAKLAAAEYATNAVKYAGLGGKFKVAIAITSADVTVHVIDAGGSATIPTTTRDGADHDSEGGRGRLLVDALADETGIEPAATCRCSPGGAGYCCWFRFTRRSSAAGVAP